jgi:hypothetical protein
MFGISKDTIQNDKKRIDSGANLGIRLTRVKRADFRELILYNRNAY